MSITITGVVKNGVVVPDAPLPEGKQVEIHVNDEPDVPPEPHRDCSNAWRYRQSGPSLKPWLN